MKNNRKLDKLMKILSKKSKKLKNKDDKTKIIILNNILSNHLNVSSSRNVVKS